MTAHIEITPEFVAAVTLCLLLILARKRLNVSALVRLWWSLWR